MKKWVCLLAVIMCCLAGCGRQQAPPGNEPGTEESTRDYVAEYQAGEKLSPINIEWKAQDPENAQTYYRQEKYIAPLFENQPANAWYGGDIGFGDSYYYFYTVYGEKDCKGFFVEHLNLSTFETEKIQYPGERGGPTGIVYDGEKIYGVFESYDKEGFVEGSVLTELLPDGTFGADIDLYEVSDEKKLLPKEPYWAYQKTVHYCAQKEVIYLIPDDESALYVLGKDGKLEYEFTGFGQGRTTVSLFARTRDGDAIFVSFDGQESTFFMYDDHEAKKLFSQPGEVDPYSYDMASCDAYGNILYLEKQANIVSWNLVTGKKERLYCGSVELFKDLNFLTRTEEGKLVMLLNDIDGRSLSLYSAAGPAQKVEIRIETESYYPYRFQEKIRKFERTHPGVTFVLGSELQNYKDHDTHVSELYREFIEGNGPDVVIMDPVSLDQFVRNHVLMDMSGLLGEEEMCILPGILEGGQVDGKQYLFPLSADAGPVLVRKSVWDKPSWTVEEVLNLLEEQENLGTEDFFFASTDGGYSRYWMMLYFFIKEIDNSPFLDPGTKTCDFEGDLFRRVLEVCKRYDEIAQTYGDNYYMDDSVRIRDFKAGKRLIYYPGMFSFNSFSILQAKLEDDCNWVGYPTDSGNGNTIKSGMGVVISNATEHKEILEEFVRCMYSFDYLTDDLGWTVPLRTDILDKTVIEKADWTDDILIRTGSRSYTSIQGKKKDGSSYKNEFMDYLKSCKSGSNAYKEVISIIQEETEPYFLNQKSVQEVQKLIQKRVYLYINEM